MISLERKLSGFTLLEAIVALAILSSGTIALYSWYSTVLLGLNAAEERLQVVEFSRNVEAHLSTLNLQSESSGDYRSNGFSAKWSAQLVEPKKDGKTLSGGPGYYQLGLYDLSIDIVREADSVVVGEMKTRLAGHTGVRIPPNLRF